jgi:hypothetical protein
MWGFVLTIPILVTKNNWIAEEFEFALVNHPRQDGCARKKIQKLDDGCSP